MTLQFDAFDIAQERMLFAGFDPFGGDNKAKWFGQKGVLRDRMSGLFGSHAQQRLDLGAE